MIDATNLPLHLLFQFDRMQGLATATLRYTLLLFQGILIFLAGCGTGSPGHRGPPVPEQSPLEVRIATRVDTLGNEYPEVEVSLPYRALVFKREAAAYVTGMTAMVVAYRGSQRIGGGVGQASLQVTDFAQTKESARLVCQVPVQLRSTEATTLEILVEVTETSRQWRRTVDYEPQVSREFPLLLQALRWNLSGEPGPAVLGISQDSLRILVTLMPRPQATTWPEAGLILVAGFGDSDSRMTGEMLRPVTAADVGPDGFTAAFTWAARDLPFGQNQLQLRLQTGSSETPEVQDLQPGRAFVNLLVPWWDDRAWRRHMTWLEGILDDDTRQELMRTEPKARLSAWRLAWRIQAAAAGEPPAVAEQNHLLRIVEADEKFTVFGRGAMTDRGRIYIRQGPPDQIETQATDLSADGRWEIWYYFRARMRYTFYDPQGMGDFHLYDSTSI